ncbi:MAG: peptidoglycan DD-metalloendopeptidase family protein [bacterium]
MRQRSNPGSRSRLLNTVIGAIITIFLFVSIPGFSAESRDPTQLQRELDTLEAEIQKFRADLDSTRGQRSELEKALELNEKEIGEILNKIKKISDELKLGEDKLSSLQSEQKDLLILKKKQQVYIARQIRGSFELGNQQYLKVVLNQEDPNQLARMLTYYDYFNRARVQQIKSYEDTLVKLETVEVRITEWNSQLTKLSSRLEIQKSGLLTVQSRKKQVLKALNVEIAETGNIIEQRIADREHLGALLERITAGIVNLPSPEDTRPFTEMKGSLLLPVVGRVIQKFGSQRSEGKLTWDGVFIEANEGTPVRSIHYGRVVFSDWLRGFGLLLIINHGAGYMSLYGHNQVLYRETGDWVSAGELISHVGNSGGQLQSGLYFEIRSAGEPSNPQLWCKARPQNKAA